MVPAVCTEERKAMPREDRERERQRVCVLFTRYGFQVSHPPYGSWSRWVRIEARETTRMRERESERR